MIKIPNVGGLFSLAVLFGPTPKATDFVLRLITDALPLANTDTNTTHTVATGGGYLDKALTNNATVALSGGIPEAVFPVQTWTFSGALTGNPTIKGYQVLNGTTLLHQELLTEFTPNKNGDQIEFTPKIKLGSGTPT